MLIHECQCNHYFWGFELDEVDQSLHLQHLSILFDTNTKGADVSCLYQLGDDIDHIPDE